MSSLSPRLLLAMLAAVAAGCASSGADDWDVNRCSLSAIVEKDAGQGFFNITQVVLDANPPLANLFAKPEIREGVGITTACADGETVLGDLQTRGAQVRRYDTHGGETNVRHDGGTYRLTLEYALRD
jgi:hypothetical protein